LSFSSEDPLSDEDWISDGGRALHFEVNLADDVLGSGPCAEDGNSVVDWVESLGASEVLDVLCGIVFGVRGISLHDDGGRVERVNTKVGINTLDHDVIESSRNQVGDSGRNAIDDNGLNDSRSLKGEVDFENIVVESSRDVPSRANVDDVAQTSVSEVKWSRGGRIRASVGQRGGDGRDK